MIEISSYDDVGGVKIGFTQSLPHQCLFIGGASTVNVNNYKVFLIQKLEGYILCYAFKENAIEGDLGGKRFVHQNAFILCDRPIGIP
jgi:hypothetical protein